MDWEDMGLGDNGGFGGLGVFSFERCLGDLWWLVDWLLPQLGLGLKLKYRFHSLTFSVGRKI